MGMETAMSTRDAIERKLTAALSPERLDVIDESHLHAGHEHVEPGGHMTFDGAGGTHLRIRIVSPAFAGLSRIERHRAVNDVLKDELAGGLHALAIEPAAPGEPTRW
jgi:BolA protein